MTTTPPPSFPMEHSEQSPEVYVRHIVDAVLAKVPQEMSKNPVWVGSGSENIVPNCLYKPHNFRLYIDFSSQGNPPYSTPLQTKSGVGSGWGEVGVAVNHGKDFVYKDFYSCTVIIRKNSMEIINLINPRWYTIEISEKAKEQIEKIVNAKVIECKSVAKMFISVFGGFSDYHILRLESENKVQGEEAISCIPDSMLFRNRVGKKIYHEDNFEFVSPAHASTYIENRAIERIAPQIGQELQNIQASMQNAGEANNLRNGLLQLIDAIAAYIKSE